MTYIKKPSPTHPGLEKNALGLTRRDYEGGLSTLCGGCGHDSITAAIVRSFFELSMPPHMVAKMSGIGCSSKTPGYFLSEAHGFNSVHGRMPSVTTGANAVHSGLTYIGVSGDGDTGSIGLGQFIHAVRRRLNMLYIIENNGVYGLTKGQFSALADLNSTNKKREQNPFVGIDPAILAIQSGASFVGRSFSGDREQLVSLIKAGLKYPGFALIDVISPCVTFNNHEGSTRSYSYTREHFEEFTLVDLIESKEEIRVDHDKPDYEVTLHDGSVLRIQRKAELKPDYPEDGFDAFDASIAVRRIEEAKKQSKILTGLLYLEREAKAMNDLLKTPKTPLRDLDCHSLCPGKDALTKINQGLR